MAAVKYPRVGPTGLKIIQAAVDGGSFTCEKASQMAAARAANGNGYLERDPKDGSIWYATDKARAMLAEHFPMPTTDIATVDRLPASPVMVADLSALAAAIERSRKYFDAGDVAMAKRLASRSYIAAKAAEEVAASERLDFNWVLKSRQMLADALKIETLCKIQLAREWNAAQAGGTALKGRRKSIGHENTFTQAEAGLTAGEIHEARQLLAEEERNPGFAERAIAARLEAGLSPSRRSLKAAIGTKTATKEERGNNLYETPPEGMDVVLFFEDFLPLVLEPFCGRGAISRRMEQEGHEVMLSDLVDYETTDQNGQVQQVRDFLTLTRDEVVAWADGEDFDIVSNPPYGEEIDACIAHALTVIQPRKMALLVNLNYLCGFTDDNRNLVLDGLKPARAIVNAQRLPMMHRDGYDGQKASSSMNTMWLVWERDEAGGYAGDFRIVRAVYQDCVPTAAESEAA